MPEEATAADRKCSLLEAARDNAAKQYDDLFRTFVALDSKAQSTATIAGVQVAAVLAFLGKSSVDKLTTQYGSGIFVLAIGTPLLLVAVVGACVWAMKVAVVPEPFGSPQEIEALKSLVALPEGEFTAETQLTHLSEHLDHWRECVEKMAAATGEKGSHVRACQYLMLAGLAASVSLFILLILAL